MRSAPVTPAGLSGGRRRGVVDHDLLRREIPDDGLHAHVARALDLLDRGRDGAGESSAGSFGQSVGREADVDPDDDHRVAPGVGGMA